MYAYSTPPCSKTRNSSLFKNKEVDKGDDGLHINLLHWLMLQASALNPCASSSVQPSTSILHAYPAYIPCKLREDLAIIGSVFGNCKRFDSVSFHEQRG